MSIKDRKLKVGTKLVAQYKRTEHQATVVKGEGDKVRYRLANGKEFSSPSAAGSEVMGGVACNGWRFWSVKGSEEAKAEKAKSESKGKAKSKAKAKAKTTAASKSKPKGKPKPKSDSKVKAKKAKTAKKAKATKDTDSGGGASPVKFD